MQILSTLETDFCLPTELMLRCFLFRFRPKDTRYIPALSAVLTKRRICEIQMRKSVFPDFLILLVLFFR